MTGDQELSQAPLGSELVQEDESFTGIVVQFVEGLSKRMTTMEGALRQADFEALRAAAHQLKGSGGGYGYPVLTEVAAELEKRAKARTLEDCTKCVDELKELFNRVVVSTD